MISVNIYINRAIETIPFRLIAIFSVTLDVQQFFQSYDNHLDSDIKLIQVSYNVKYSRKHLQFSR